jgi:hypothetical protein
MRPRHFLECLPELLACLIRPQLAGHIDEALRLFGIVARR